MTHCETHRYRNELTQHQHRTLEQHTTLYHVGRLDEDRVTPRFSQEGGELSVSHVPQDWRRIADHVGGHTYELQNPDGLFYAVEPVTSVTDAERDIALQAGYTREVTGYRADYTAENGDDVYTLHYNREDAEEKLDWYPDGEISEVTVHQLADRGEAYWEEAFCRDPDSASPFEVRLLIPIWAASTLDVDGVYWHHPLDVDELSAPRGLIYQERLDDWDQRIIRESQY